MTKNKRGKPIKTEALAEKNQAAEVRETPQDAELIIPNLPLKRNSPINITAEDLDAEIQKLGATLSKEPGTVNVIYVQSDISKCLLLRFLLVYENNTPVIKHAARCSRRPTVIIPVGGTAKAWKIGSSSIGSPCLIQVAPIKCYRGGRDVTKLTKGMDQCPPAKSINLSDLSLRCESAILHGEFMALLRKDKRYIDDPGYVFETTFIP